jgi:acyl-homoserine lactone acylase PvdQ
VEPPRGPTARGRAVQAFEEALWRRTFSDEIPDQLYDRFYRYAGNERFAGLHAVDRRRRSPWFDDLHTPNVTETRRDIARQAAADAIAALGDRFGDQENWRWGEMHAVKFRTRCPGAAACWIGSSVAARYLCSATA